MSDTYHILEHDSLEGLVEEVLKFVEAGWICQGGVTVYQRMVTTDTDKFGCSIQSPVLHYAQAVQRYFVTKLMNPNAKKWDNPVESQVDAAQAIGKLGINEPVILSRKRTNAGGSANNPPGFPSANRTTETYPVQHPVYVVNVPAVAKEFLLPTGPKSHPSWWAVTTEPEQIPPIGTPIEFRCNGELIDEGVFQGVYGPGGRTLAGDEEGIFRDWYKITYESLRHSLRKDQTTKG